MRNYLVFLIFLLPAFGKAQQIEKAYDANWKETSGTNIRYYSIITKKDSLWRRQDFYIPEKTLQMEGYYKDSSCKIKHGEFIYFYSNKNLQFTGKYIDNKKNGLWLEYHSNKMMADSAFYVNGKIKGDALKWNEKGMPTDSIHSNADGTFVLISWFENGLPSQAGRLDINDKKIGKWQFFYPDGTLSALVVFKEDKEESVQLFDKNGIETSDTSLKHREALYKGDDAAWRKYIERTVNARVAVDNRAPVGTYMVIVTFAVDIDGKIINPQVETNFGYGMESEAINVIKKAPKWEPAYYYGRPVKAYRRQPIIFKVM